MFGLGVKWRDVLGPGVVAGTLIAGCFGCTDMVVVGVELKRNSFLDIFRQTSCYKLGSLI